jgi:protein O-mannosyl-transferase
LSDAAAPGPELRSAADDANCPLAYSAARKRRLHQVLIGALCLLSLAVYANSLRCGLILDNRPLILDDSRVHALHPDNLKLVFQLPYWPRIQTSGLYRPVTTLSYLLNYAVSGQDPRGYHVVNLALQCLNIGLVYLLCYRIFGSFAMAFGACALWGAHPLLTESVTNIVGRADLLSGAAVLAGLFCHMRALEDANGSYRLQYAAGLMVLMTAGIFSKESTVVLPALILGYDLIFRPRETWRCRAGYFALLPPLVLWWWARSRVLLPPLHPAVDNPLLLAGFWQAKLTAIKIIGRYFSLLALPWSLSTDYSYNQIPLVTWNQTAWQSMEVLAALLLCVLSLASAILCYRRSKPVCFWIAFAGITFLPISNLVVFIGSIMAERFMYLPAIGFAACLSWILFSIGERVGFPRLAPVTIALIWFAFGARTFARNFEWRNDETLARSAVSASPNSLKSHKGLAFVFYAKTPPELDPAIHEIERSIEIERGLPDSERIAAVYATAGRFYRQKGESIEVLGVNASALVWYEKSRDALLQGMSIDRIWQERFRRQHLRAGISPSRIGPTGLPEVYLQLGATYLKLNHPQQALEVLEYGRKLEPENIEFYGLIANAYAAQKNFERQAIALLEAVTMFPDDKRLPRLLRAVYSRVDIGGCPAGSWDALSERLHLNLDCPAIEQHVCKARENMAKLLAEIKQETLAGQLRRSAPPQLRCR